MSIGNTLELSKDPQSFNLSGLNTPFNILMATVETGKKILEDMLDNTDYIISLQMQMLKEDIPFELLDLTYENFDENIVILKDISQYILTNKLYTQHIMYENDPDLWAEIVLFS